jgi:hypothetical protein
VHEPQLIDDQEHERVFEKVAAIDVAKAAGVVCTRAPHLSRPGARRSTVWTVPAMMGAVRALAAQLAGLGIEKVTLESTSDCWRIWFTCWRRPGWTCNWLPPARHGNCPAGPRPTGWMRCGWPG